MNRCTRCTLNGHSCRWPNRCILLDSTCNEYLTSILYSCVPSPAEVMQGGTTCRNKEDLHHISYSQELKKSSLYRPRLGAGQATSKKLHLVLSVAGPQ